MKKIYYIPGIFSIILLPILSIWYMNKYDYFQKLSANAFTNIDFEEIERMTKNYDHVNYGLNEFKTRIYKEVYLNNEKNSKNTFKYIDQFVNGVVQTKDTVDGLKIHFEEKATYNEFIEVLNIFAERDAELYILDENIMYFVGRDWDSNAKGFEGDFEDLVFLTCGTGYYEEEISDFKLFTDTLKTQFSQNEIIYSTYVIFVLIESISVFFKSKKLP